jgi:asparagine synthase (glutamine-hydrolysing)
MCGIAGFVDFSGHDREQARERVKAMTDAIPHRGPDADGFYLDSKVALGHRRLSIIDVASGHQPMAAADGQIQIAFNGEIYNHLTLRDELDCLGASPLARTGVALGLATAIISLSTHQSAKAFLRASFSAS